MFRVLIKQLTNVIFVIPIIFLQHKTLFLAYTLYFLHVNLFYIVMQTSLVYFPHTNNWREFTNMAGHA